MKCKKCNREFPRHLMQPMTIIDLAGIKKRLVIICPICKLGIMNQVRGLPVGTPHKSKYLQAMYEEAIKLYPLEKEKTK